jgi:hypothetical protein
MAWMVDLLADMYECNVEVIDSILSNIEKIV